MGTIISYPPALTPLTNEPVAIWQGGQQRQAPANAFFPPSVSGGAFSVSSLASLATATPPSVATVIIVGKYLATADSLANSALASACPKFCVADALGRYWRALPGLDGFLNLSQAGLVPLSGLGNAQPFTQALINYAKAIGCEFIRHDLAAVDIWCPLRTSSADTSSYDVAFALDGQPLVVQASLHIEGLPNKSIFNFKGHTGGPWATDIQIVGGILWRGSMVNIMGGTQAAPGANAIDFFSMKNIKLDGGTMWDGTFSPASTIASPTGQDLTNKGIRCQDTTINRVWLEDIEICGVQGEIYYMAAGNGTYATPRIPQALNRVHLHDSNQSAFNPSVGGFDVTDCLFGNARIAYEILGGVGGSIDNTTMYNSEQSGSTGGPANGLLYNYAFPTRIAGISPPWLYITNSRWVGGPLTGQPYAFNAGMMNILAQNYTYLTGAASDCFGTSSALPNGALLSIYIDMTMTYDQFTPTYVWQFQGPPAVTASTVAVAIAAPNAGTTLGATMQITVPLSALFQYNYGTGVYITDGTNTIQGVVTTTTASQPPPTTMAVFVQMVNGSTSATTETAILAAGATITAVIPGSGNVPIAAPVDIKARLRVRRTAVAQAAGSVTTAYGLSGVFNQHTCTMILDEGDGIAQILNAGGTSGILTVGAMPLVQVTCPTNSDTLGIGAPDSTSVQITATGSLALNVASPRMALGNSGAAAVIPVTIAKPFAAPYDYAHGQLVTINWSAAYSTVGTVYSIAQFASGVALKANRKLWDRSDKLILRYNVSVSEGITTGIWVEEEYVSGTYNLSGAATITPASLATGAFGIVGTANVLNAFIGDQIESVTASTLTGGVKIWGEVTTSQTVIGGGVTPGVVTIYARNDKGSAYAPGATVFTVIGHRS